MGVWIETCVYCKDGKSIEVTPRVGVWIETYLVGSCFIQDRVTPRVGVWIETFAATTSVKTEVSLPAWECGLKHPPGSRR